MQEILNIFLLEVSKIVEHNVNFIMHWRQFTYLCVGGGIINLVANAICRVVRLGACCLLVADLPIKKLHYMAY